MIRRNPWIERFIIVLLVLAWCYHLVVDHLLPNKILKFLQRTSNDIISVGHIKIGFPIKLILSDVSWIQPKPGLGLSIKRVIVVPSRVSFKQNKIWINKLRLIQPKVYARRSSAGKNYFPSFRGLNGEPADDVIMVSDWNVLVDEFEIYDGVFNFFDEEAPQPAQLSFSGLSVFGGPFELPGGASRISLAVQGNFTGYKDNSSAFYCSGWADFKSQSLDCSCHLKPLKLAAFQPYYRWGPLKEREYDATLEATGIFNSKSNDFEGRVQLQISGFSKSDIEDLSKPLDNLTNISELSEPKLSGEIQIIGPMDQWKLWKLQLAPGNEIVQQLVKPLINRGRDINLKLGTAKIPVGVTSSTEAVMSVIEETSKTVQEDLKMLAPVLPVAIEKSAEEAVEIESEKSGSESTEPASVPVHGTTVSGEQSVEAAPSKDTSEPVSN